MNSSSKWDTFYGEKKQQGEDFEYWYDIPVFEGFPKDDYVPKRGELLKDITGIEPDSSMNPLLFVSHCCRLLQDQTMSHRFYECTKSYIVKKWKRRKREENIHEEERIPFSYKGKNYIIASLSFLFYAKFSDNGVYTFDVNGVLVKNSIKPLLSLLLKLVCFDQDPKLSSDVIDKLVEPSIETFPGEPNLNMRYLIFRDCIYDQEEQREIDRIPYDTLAVNPTLGYYLKSYTEEDVEFVRKTTQEYFSSQRDFDSFKSILGAIVSGNMNNEKNRYLVCLVGPKRSGKTTIAKAIRNALAQVSATLPYHFLYQRQEEASSEISCFTVSLRNKALIFINETLKNKTVSSSMIKGLISGDILTGRSIHENLQSFVFSGTLFITSNFPLQTDDPAVQDRIINIQVNKLFDPDIENESETKKKVNEKNARKYTKETPASFMQFLLRDCLPLHQKYNIIRPEVLDEVEEEEEEIAAEGTGNPLNLLIQEVWNKNIVEDPNSVVLIKDICSLLIYKLTDFPFSISMRDIHTKSVSKVLFSGDIKDQNKKPIKVTSKRTTNGKALCDVRLIYNLEDSPIYPDQKTEDIISIQSLLRKNPELDSNKILKQLENQGYSYDYFQFNRITRNQFLELIKED